MNHEYVSESTLCRNCNSAEVSFLFTAKNHDIHRCNQCSYDQVMPLPSSDKIIAIYANKYFDKGKYIDDFAGKKEQNRRLRLLKSAGIKNGSKIE